MLMMPVWRAGTQLLPIKRPLPPNPLYVDTTVMVPGIGTIDSPVDSLVKAIAMCAGLPDWVIRIKAPKSNPVRTENIYESTEALLIEGWDKEPWHAMGSELVTDWTDIGGGVYSKVLGWTSTSLACVTTMQETIGDRQFEVKLLPNILTPTTPEAGQLGYAGDTVYIRLPGDENPNNHGMEVARRNAALRTRGFGKLVVQDMEGRYFLSAGLTNGLAENPLGTGKLEAIDCLIEYTANNGIGVAGQSETTVCTRVRSYRCANDGFNHHRTSGSAILTLNGCDGSYNGDVAGSSAQGASNHEDTTMIINGGKFNHNVSGGMVVIDTARCDIHGDTEYGPVIMDRNMRLGNTAGSISGQAGCAWLNSSTGLVTGPVTVSNGQGVGVRRNSSAVVNGIGLIASTGNSLPDII